jgi:hypothetical protein
MARHSCPILIGAASWQSAECSAAQSAEATELDVCYLCLLVDFRRVYELSHRATLIHSNLAQMR